MAIDKINSEGLLLSDDFAFTGTVTGAGGVNTPFFVARKSGDQTGISNQTETKITGWVEITDPQSTFDTSNARFTPAVAGNYRIGLTAWIATEANTRQALRIKKNGSTVEQVQVSTGGDVNIPVHISAIITCDTDDYIEPYVYLDGSQTRSVYSSGVEMQFSGFKIIE